MTGLGIALALLSASFHATWNLLLKTSNDPLRLSAQAMSWSAVIATPVALLVWFGNDRPVPPPQMWLFAAASGLAELAYFSLLSTAYRGGGISNVYPVARGSAPVFAIGAATLLLGQRLPPIQVAGVTLVIAGIWLVRPPATQRRSLGLALATGLAIATYTTIDQVGVSLAPFWLYSWAKFTATGLALAPFRGRASVARALPVGALTLAAYSMVLAALSLAPVVLVAPLRETGVVLVAVWAVVRLGERDRAIERLTGAVVVTAGVALIATTAS